MAPDVSVLIVSYNSLEWLRRCVAAVPAACGPLTPQLVIVDNASRDGSAAWLAGHGGADVVLNRDNLGFTRAMNQALARARGRFVLWLNVDCVLDPGALEHGVRFLEERPEYWAVGGRLRDESGREQPSALAFPGWTAVLFHVTGVKRLLELPGARAAAARLARWSGSRYAGQYLAGPGRDGFRDADWVTGALLLTRAETVGRIGGLDERFWMYCEDTDWCRRVRLAGGRVAALPAMSGLHAVGGGGGSSPFALCHYYRSMWLYQAKHASAPLVSHLLLVLYFACRSAAFAWRAPAGAPSARDPWQALLRWAGDPREDPCDDIR